MREKIEIKIPRGTRFLSDIPDFILPEGIVDKELTGCGATTLALIDSVPTILASPRRALVLNKAGQFPPPGSLAVVSGVYKNHITEYLEDCRKEGIPAIQWSKAIKEINTDPTEKLLTWIGRPLTYKPKLPLKRANLLDLQGYGNDEQYPGLLRMTEMWEKDGVDLGRIGVEDLGKIYTQRWSALMRNRPARFSILEPSGINGYNLTDYRGLRPVGRGQVLTHDSGNLYFGNITNNTRFDEKPVKGVFERGLNSLLNAAHSEGRLGVVTGEQYLSAPRQIPVVEKFGGRSELPGRGHHSNYNMVKDHRNRHKLPLFNWDDEEKVVSSLSEMKAAGETQEVVFPNAPAWLLTEPTYHVPTKATIFSPRSIDASGNMIINWNSPFIFSRGGKVWNQKK